MKGKIVRERWTVDLAYIVKPWCVVQQAALLMWVYFIYCTCTQCCIFYSRTLTALLFLMSSSTFISYWERNCGKILSLLLLLLIKIHSLIIFKPTSLLQLHAGCVLDNGCVSNALNKGFISSMYSALYRVEIKKKKPVGCHGGLIKCTTKGMK